MRTSILLLTLLLILFSASHTQYTLARSEYPSESFNQGPPPPSPPKIIRFFYDDKRIEIREQEPLIVGEIVADCLPVYQQFANVRVVSEDTPFVFLEDDSCPNETTGSRFRYKIRIAPVRGDAGKYEIVIVGDACGSRAEIYTIKIKVKKEERKQ